MTRGYFNQIDMGPAYTESSKNWHITLDRSNCFWYELIVNPPAFVDTRRDIADYLRWLKSAVEQTLEKRFIYFFVSRKKVRFDTTKQPKYSLFGKYLVLRLLIGKDGQSRTIKRKVFDQSGKQITPKVEVTDSFIRFYQHANSSETYSIHDFLQMHDIALGITSEIHYVGITKNPGDRPISREHRGITDTLYRVSNEDNDFFIFINLFKVMSNAESSKHGINFVIANSMIDEIPTEEEGQIIEGALINYFNTEAQQLNKRNESAVLNNRLASIAKNNNIEFISLQMELEHPNEYFVFGSQAVPPSVSHTFVCRSVNGSLEITKLNSEEEIRDFRAGQTNA